MTDVFVSYKREDELRVAKLVSALECCGLSVWWDRSLPGAENWRDEIAKALESAKCTIVVWTQSSTGAEGSFVLDEASRAAKAARLVPVSMDHGIDFPLGFGELQAIDLTRWQGRIDDPFFQDLLATIKAKIEGGPVPTPRGPLARIRRKITFGAAFAALAAILSAFASNTLDLQERFCGVSWMQPGVSDVCGALGLGVSPTRKERLAWENKVPGSCTDLRKHLREFPGGAFREQATALLDARTVTSTTSWRMAPAPMVLRVFLVQGEAAQETRELAEGDAKRRGVLKATKMCRDFDASHVTRLVSAEIEPQEWNCNQTTDGFTCGFEGQIFCHQEALSKSEGEQCGFGAKP